MKKGLLLLLFIVTGSAKGQVAFQKFYTGADNYHAPSVITFNDNSAIIGPSPLIKINEFGNIVWAKKIYLADSSSYTGRLLKTFDEKLLMEFPIDLDVLIKVDTSGNVIWNKRYASEKNLFYNLQLQSESSDKGFILSGQKGNGFVLLKVDSSGNPQWCKNYTIDTSVISGPAFISSVIQTDDGGFLLGGQLPYNNQYTSSILFTVKINPAGSIVHAFANYNRGKLTSGNNFFRTGTNRYLLLGMGSNMCFDSTGFLVWERKCAMLYIGKGAMKNNGHVFFPGGILDSIGFSRNGFIEIDTAGNIIQCIHYNSPDTFGIGAINVFPDGRFISSGTMSKQNIFGLYLLKGDTNNLTGCFEAPLAIADTGIIADISLPLNIIENIDSVIVTFDTPIVSAITLHETTFCYTGLYDFSHKKINIQIYPNPSTDKITINGYQLSGKEMRVLIYDIMGKEVLFTPLKIRDQKTEVEVSSLAKGIYVVRVSDGSENYYTRFVKE